MKRFSLLAVLGVLGVVLLSACAPVAGAYVLLDPALAEWVMIGATVLVAFLLAKASEIPFVKRLLDYFKVNDYRLAISAWLGGVIIQTLQANILDRIPATFDAIVTIVMQLIVAVIVTLYGFRLLKDRGVQGFR